MQRIGWSFNLQMCSYNLYAKTWTCRCYLEAWCLHIRLAHCTPNVGSSNIDYCTTSPPPARGNERGGKEWFLLVEFLNFTILEKKVGQVFPFLFVCCRTLKYIIFLRFPNKLVSTTNDSHEIQSIWQDVTRGVSFGLFRNVHCNRFTGIRTISRQPSWTSIKWCEKWFFLDQKYRKEQRLQQWQKINTNKHTRKGIQLYSILTKR